MGNLKDTCPSLAIEARDEAEWVDGFAVIIKDTEWDLESDCGGFIMMGSVICRLEQWI